MSPLALLFCAVSTLKKGLCRVQKPSVPVVSIGNLVVGGSGKTPVLIELAGQFEDVAVVLRGYGRQSRGTLVVSRRGEIEVDVDGSGDEAMLIARSLPKASVIVSEDRMAGIEAATKLGAKAVFLDDAFHHCIQKLDILIHVESPNRLCLPAGPYRLPKGAERSADLLLQENRDFRRFVTLRNPTKKMVLLTAIANPKRLDPFLPKGIKRYHFADHHNFTKTELERIWRQERPESFLVTSKDLVKLERYDYPLSLLELRIKLDPEVIERVRDYIQRGADAKETPNSPDAA